MMTAALTIMLMTTYASLGIQGRARLVHSRSLQGLPDASIWSDIDKYILGVVRQTFPSK